MDIQANTRGIDANKWELAQRLSGHVKTPEQALAAIFNGSMSYLESEAQTPFVPSLRIRVWEKVSPGKLNILKEVFFEEFCNKTLGGFREKEVGEMLAEHQQTGVVKDLHYCACLRMAYEHSKKSILSAVVQKADGMVLDWIPDLVNALRQEGVPLPEPKANTSQPVAETPRIPPSERLAKAVYAGDLEGVKEALKDGADPCKDSKSRELIHTACEKGNVDIVCALLDAGTPIDHSTSKWDYTPLHRACLYGRPEVVKELIRRGAPINIKSSNGWTTPLDNAISSKDVECCKLLIQAGAPLGNTSNYRSTPLEKACINGSYEIVKLLLDSGANPNESTGATALYHSVGYPQVVQLMLERGASPHQLNKDYKSGQTPLHAAAFIGYDESVRLLLQEKADPAAKDGSNQTPLSLARWQLNYHQTTPCNSPEVTAQIIQRLKNVIRMLEEHA